MSRTFYEFFAGGGMARLGLGPDWRCAFANDFDPVKAAAYRDNFSDAATHFRLGDVWNLKASDLPGRADLAWASSPCQDFSLAGTRAGLAGGRSSAFFGFWRLMEALDAEGRAPRTVVIENVVGLLTSHGGADFAALCRALFSRGYRFGALEIDAARFVPQSRSRVFVVATKHDVTPSLTQVEGTLPFHSQRVLAAFEGLSEELKSRWVWWHLPYPPANNESLEAILDNDDDAVWFSADRVARLEGLLGSRHQEKLRAARARQTRTVGTLFRRMRVENGSKVQRAELRFDGFAGCLRTPAGGSSKQVVVVVEGKDVRMRELSAQEAFRLMGIDESYKLPRRKTAALKIAGDGVVVDVVRWLASNLLEHLNDASCDRLNGEEEWSWARAGGL